MVRLSAAEVVMDEDKFVRSHKARIAAMKGYRKIIWPKECHALDRMIKTFKDRLETYYEVKRRQSDN